MKNLKLNNEEVVIETTVSKDPFAGFVAKIKVNVLPYEQELNVKIFGLKGRKMLSAILEDVEWRNYLVDTINKEIKNAEPIFDEDEYDFGLATEIVEIALMKTSKILNEDLVSHFAIKNRDNFYKFLPSFHANIKGVLG